MKRKILLIAMMVAILACLFALCISAETVTYEGKEIELVNNLGDPSWYTGNTAIAIKDKESIVILKDSEGNMTAYPSYYILRFGVDMKDGVPTNVYVLWDDQNGVDYSFINEKLGTSYAYGSVYYIEFPYGMTLCKNNRLFGRENGGAKEVNCVEIVLPDSVNTIESQAFRMMDSCKRINIPAAVTSIPNWAFCGSKMLETVIFSEGSLLETTAKSFSDCTSLSSINIEDCTNLKTLGGEVFNGCTSLRELTLPDSIETIGNKAFYKIGVFGFTSDYLPKNLKTIGTHFLSGCNIQNEVLYFPTGFTSLDAQYHFNDGAKYEGEGNFTLVFLGKMTALRIDSMAADGPFPGVQIIFAQNTADELNGKFFEGTTFKDNYAYIAKDSTGALAINKEVTTGTLTLTLRNWDPNSNSEAGTDANGNKIYSINSSTPRFIFCGDDSVDLVYQVRNSISGWNYYLTTPFAYDMDAHATANNHYNSIDYQERNCGYDECTTYTCVICDLVNKVYTDKKATGEHTINDDFNCETALNCEVCKKTLAEALSHVNVVTITYENGYIVAGKKITACSNEGCNHELSEEIDAIFTYVGFSLKADDSGSICIGYLVNEAVADEYALVNTSFAFGVVGYIPVANENPLEVVDGKAVASEQQYTIQADITSQTMSAFDFVIAGFGTNTDVNLVMCAYVCDGTSVYYLNIDQTTNEVAQSTSATTFSYDGLKAYMDANEVA